MTKETRENRRKSLLDNVRDILEGREIPGFIILDQEAPTRNMPLPPEKLLHRYNPQKEDHLGKGKYGK